MGKIWPKYPSPFQVGMRFLITLSLGKNNTYILPLCQLALPYTRPMGYRPSKVGWSVGASSIGMVGFSGMPHPLFDCKTDVLLVEGPWRMVTPMPPSIVLSECNGQQWTALVET